MLVRWLLATGSVLLVTTAAAAQAPDCVCPDRPVELPPLLTPPMGDPNPRVPPGPRGPRGEYDHGYLYLPEAAPPTVVAPDQCRPLGRWWVGVTLELAWMPQSTAPGAVRLRVPDGVGGSIPGPVLPASGLSTDTFQGGFGLTLGRWFGERNVHGIDASLYTVGSDRTFDGFAPGMLVVFPNGADASAPQVIVLPPPLASTLV